MQNDNRANRLTSSPCTASEYPSEPRQIDSAILERAGLTNEYREELDTLTRYLQKAKPHNLDCIRFLINLLLINE